MFKTDSGDNKCGTETANALFSNPYIVTCEFLAINPSHLRACAYTLMSFTCLLTLVMLPCLTKPLFPPRLKLFPAYLMILLPSRPALGPKITIIRRAFGPSLA